MIRQLAQDGVRVRGKLDRVYGLLYYEKAKMMKQFADIAESATLKLLLSEVLGVSKGLLT